jgi:Chromate transporter
MAWRYCSHEWFILPSMLIMIALAIIYKHVHSFSETERFFHGLNGAVVALILVTAWRMGKNILTRRWQWLLALLAFVAVAVLNATVLEVVFAAGLIGIYVDTFGEKQWRRLRSFRSLAARRRAGIRVRMAKRRRRRSQDFFRNFISRPLNEPVHETNDEETVSTEREESTTFRSLSVLALGMPLLARVAAYSLSNLPAAWAVPHSAADW